MALKLKARMIGQINKLKIELAQQATKIVQVNGGITSIPYEDIDQWQTEYAEKYLKYFNLTKKLIELKTKIQIANVKFAATLVSLDELKTNMKWIEEITNMINNSVRGDSFLGFSGKDNDVPMLRRTIPAMDPNYMSKELETLRETINRLQDELDASNASTTIEWDD
jgi:hypothetical protein